MFTTIEAAREFALAGNAILTISSLKTGAHFTYRVKQVNDQESRQPIPGLYFVSLLNGPDNQNDYCYLGLIRGGRFTLTKEEHGGKREPKRKSFLLLHGHTNPAPSNGNQAPRPVWQVWPHSLDGELAELELSGLRFHKFPFRGFGRLS